MDSADNKIIYIPTLCAPVGKGVIIHRTNQYTKRSLDLGDGRRIIIPNGHNQEAERKYDVGEVRAVGDEVKEVAVGDIVLWQKSTGFRVPNGIDEPVMWKVEEFPMSIVAILPNLDPDKRSKRWDDVPGLEEALAPYVKMLAELSEEDAAETSARSMLPTGTSIPSVHLGELEGSIGAEFTGGGDD